MLYKLKLLVERILDVGPLKKKVDEKVTLYTAKHSQC